MRSVRPSAGACLACPRSSGTAAAFRRVGQSGSSLRPSLVRTRLVALPMISRSCSSASIVASADSSRRCSCFASSGLSASSRQRSISSCHCGWRFQTQIAPGPRRGSRPSPCASGRAPARRPPAEHERRSCAATSALADPEKPRPSASSPDPFVASVLHRQRRADARGFQRRSRPRQPPALAFALQNVSTPSASTCPRTASQSEKLAGSPEKASSDVTRPPSKTPGELHRRSEEHTSELQSRPHLVCRLLLEKKKKKQKKSSQGKQITDRQRKINK